MTGLQLRLAQASQRFSVEPADALADFRRILSKGMDAVGFTEASNFHPQLLRAAKEKHYHLVLPPDGDTAIAVHGDHEVTGHDFHAVVPGVAGSHRLRGIQAVAFTPRDTQERVTFAEAHWLTHRSDDGGQRLAITREMADVMREAAGGSRLGFWAGDTNNPDRPSATSPVDLALRKGELTSCWDELGRYPATFGEHHTLDVVGSYDPDGRVSCTGARVWANLHSDHRPLSATYHVRPRQTHG